MLEITSLSHFNSLTKSSPLLIIDFYATWCGPCKAISPAFQKHSVTHAANPSVVFAQVDVDKAKDVAQKCGISAMPTFQFFRQGRGKVDEVKGADVQQLTTKIGYWVGEVGKAGPGTSTAGSKEGKLSGSLNSLIDVGAGRLLGASNLSSIRNIASPPPAGYAVASAAGSSQLLLYIPFTVPVTPTHIKLTIVKDALSAAPSRIQIGSNVPVKITKSPEGVESNDLSFENSLGKAEGTQAFNVFSDEYVGGTAELKLKGSKFGGKEGVRSLVLVVEKNLSGEEKSGTKIARVEILGSQV